MADEPGHDAVRNDLREPPPATGVLLAALYQALPQVEPVLLVRALNLLVILTLTLLVYILAKRLTGSERAALLSVLFWALWEPVYGNQLFYFDTIVGLLLTLVAIIALDAQRMGAIILCGILLGLATLFKQPAWGAAGMFGLRLPRGARRKSVRTPSAPAISARERGGFALSPSG